MSAIVAAETPMHTVRARITHADLEHHFMNYVRQTPEYDIRNVGMNPLLLIPALFIPNSNNTILDRIRRLRSQKFYIVSASTLDKVSIALSLASVGVGLMIAARQYRIGAKRVYLLPEGTHDPRALEELAHMNGVWSTQTWEVLKLILACFPAVRMWWRAFKRTSVPTKAHRSFRVPKLAALAEQNKKNREALRQLARRVSVPRTDNKLAVLEAKLQTAIKEIEQLKQIVASQSRALEEKRKKA